MKSATNSHSRSIPRGFRAAGVHAGIKRGNAKDMGLIVSDAPASIAGTFTTNRVRAAPVLLCQKRIAGRVARAIVVNSGNANACTGKRGKADAEGMAALAAGMLGIPPRTVFVCSTGVIGVPMPMDIAGKGIRLAANRLSTKGWADAAEAIMTTDTRPKLSCRRLRAGGSPITLAGIAKGSGMISPHMATMLAFFITDANIEAAHLQACLSPAVENSFNRITVDGDQSTNDTVLLMANGAAGGSPIGPRKAGWRPFRSALDEMASELATMIARDGEGATKLVTVRVVGASGKKAAEKVARSVACSPLVKTAWHGADPNWGRIICAVGNAGVKLDPGRIDIAIGGRRVASAGRALKFDPGGLRRMMSKPGFTVEIDLNSGTSSCEIYTCDYSEEYVRINASYTT